jgi:sugar-specific transcriptional regulator TrmB
MSALEAVGLVSRVTGQLVRYQPAPPGIALEGLVRAREQELQHVRLLTARLSERYTADRGTARPEEIVEVVATREATLQRWEQLQRSVRREVRAFDRPPYAASNLANHPEEDLLAAGISVRCVYARRAGAPRTAGWRQAPDRGRRASPGRCRRTGQDVPGPMTRSG